MIHQKFEMLTSVLLEEDIPRPRFAPVTGHVLLDTPLHVLQTSPGQAPPLPLIDLGGTTWLVPFVFEVDMDEEFGGKFTPWCEMPEDHWLDWEMSENGQPWLEDDSAHLSQALEWGVAPGQVFYLRVGVEVHGPSYYDNEYDYYWSAELLWKEEYSERETLQAWEEFLVARGKQRSEDEDHEAAWEARVKLAPTWVELDYNMSADSAVLRLYTAAERPCRCHSYSPILETESVRKDSWVQWMRRTIAEKGWGALPLILDEREAAHYLQHWTAEGYEVPLPWFPRQEGRPRKVVLPPIDDMDEVAAVTDAKWRLMTMESDDDEDDE